MFCMIHCTPQIDFSLIFLRFRKKKNKDMPRYAQLVMGPAACGKSTYCSTISKHCEVIRRRVQIVNLDPAADAFDYPVAADVRDLISVDDVMEDEDLHFGPNGGLMFAMQYLVDNLDWLDEAIGEDDDDYWIFDCPGQIELYTHTDIIKRVINHLKQLGFEMCAVFLLDAQFLIEPSKFIGGMLAALSAMVNLELPHINVLSKVDLLNREAKDNIDKFTDPNAVALSHETTLSGEKFKKLNRAVAALLDDYSLVQFVPLDPTDEDCVALVLLQVDGAMHYGEDQEPREMNDDMVMGNDGPPVDFDLDSGVDS